MITIHTILKGEKGFVLPVGLMFLGILCVLGSTAVVVTTTDIQIGANHKAGAQAVYSTNAGYEEARARLGSGSIGQVGTPDADWRGFIGDAASAAGIFGYDSSDSDHFLYASLQSDLTYTVMIRHKVDASGNIMLWGDSDGDYVYEENLTTGDPIEIVTSRGMVGNARRTVMVIIQKQIPLFDPPAALYVNGNLDKQNVSGEAIGSYNPACDPMPDIVTTTNAGACPPPATKSCEASDWPAGTSDPFWYVDNETNIYPVTTVVNQLGTIADNTIPPGSYTNPTGWGSVASPNEISYCNGDLEVNNLVGSGILVVLGDMTLKGNITWDGIIMVKGTTTFSGGGHVSIIGAVVADSVTYIDGQPDIYYDCTVIENLKNSNATYLVTNWTEFPDLIYYP